MIFSILVHCVIQVSELWNSNIVIDCYLVSTLLRTVLKVQVNHFQKVPSVYHFVKEFDRLFQSSYTFLEDYKIGKNPPILFETTYLLVTATSSGILKAKQKLGRTFNSNKLGGIAFTKISKLTMCSA